MQDRPTAAELLAVVAQLLEDEVLPATAGPLQHRVRVGAHLLRVLERETQLGARLLLDERDVLLQLLGQSSETLLPGPLTEQVADLNQQLLDELVTPPGPARALQITDVLLQVARGKLSVAKPGYDGWPGDPAPSHAS